MVGLVIVVMFGLIIQIYSSSKMRELEMAIEKEKEREAVAISQIALYAPEIKCNNEDYCIELEKARAANKSKKLEELYKKLFGYGYIRIIQIYPTSFNLTVYNNSLEKSMSSYTYRYTINIYNTSSKKEGLGILEINKQYPR